MLDGMFFFNFKVQHSQHHILDRHMQRRLQTHHTAMNAVVQFVFAILHLFTRDTKCQLLIRNLNVKELVCFDVLDNLKFFKMNTFDFVYDYYLIYLY